LQTNIVDLYKTKMPRGSRSFAAKIRLSDVTMQ